MVCTTNYDTAPYAVGVNGDKIAILWKPLSASALPNIVRRRV